MTNFFDEVKELLLHADGCLAKITTSGDDTMRIAVSRQVIKDVYVKISERENEEEKKDGDSDNEE